MDAQTQILWTLLAVMLFCVVQAVRDLRRRNYPMAALAILCILLLGLMPLQVQTHAVKIDFPPSSH